ncbi:quercetin dioxygenase-like cupin family protein [Paraburkholderia graminis]|nr:quercetin dioxygenase-like cupin family protein [Paraburkholderia graminis]
MKLHTLIAAATLAGFGMLATSQPALAADSTGQAAAAAETITPAFAEAIANVPGKKMTALVVDYAPGGKSSPHRHGKAFVVAYVLSGAIRSGVDGKEAQVFHAGEHWIEKAGRASHRQRKCERYGAGPPPRHFRGGHKRQQARHIRPQEISYK